MSSENEIVNQAGDDEPENETAPQQPDPVPEPVEFAETAVAPALDAVVDEDDDLEDDWEAWIEANPDEEEVFEAPAAPAGEPESISEDDEELLADAVEMVAASESEAGSVPETVVEEVEEAAENEAAVSADEMLEEAAEPVAQSPSLKPQKQQKPRRDGLKADHVISYFAPCGRCGYFLTGYRALYGGDDLETAVSKAKSGWLTLTWSMEMQYLVLKSYGSRIESNDLHFDGCCSECRRAFVYKSAPSENKPATFRIEIKPRKRQ